MPIEVNGSIATWWWSCDHGCPPIRMRVPVSLQPFSATAHKVQCEISVDMTHPLVRGAFAAHMAGVHA